MGVCLGVGTLPLSHRTVATFHCGAPPVRIPMSIPMSRHPRAPPVPTLPQTLPHTLPHTLGVAARGRSRLVMSKRCTLSELITNSGLN